MNGASIERSGKDGNGTAGDAVVAVEGLSYIYPGAERPTLRGIDFAIERGEVFGFLGPSGAGKSTTQNVLTGLLTGYEGTVKVFDGDVSTQGGSYYERIGIAAESPNHYQKLTGRENVQLFASLYAGETRAPAECLSLVGLDDAADRRVGAYSKGMGMRLNLARALVNDPELLFLDEPTNGLDPGNARRVRGIVADLAAEGTTVFLTTHDMAVADRLCDRVAFIVSGTLPVIDAPKALKISYGAPTVAVEHRGDGRLSRTEFDLATLADDERFAELLRSGTVETLHTEEASLEDVFLAITGRGLR